MMASGYASSEGVTMVDDVSEALSSSMRAGVIVVDIV